MGEGESALAQMGGGEAGSAKKSPMNDEQQAHTPRGWLGKLPPPELWSKLKPLARQMRQEPTRSERRLWQQVRRKQRLGYKFRRQHAIERFIVDFYCPEARLVVEVDGPVHQYTHEEDMVRQEFLQSLGLRVLRFTDDEVMNSLEGVIHQIDEALRHIPE
jgi:very-short-patch-repair endonuclease